MIRKGKADGESGLSAAYIDTAVTIAIDVNTDVYLGGIRSVQASWLETSGVLDRLSLIPVTRECILLGASSRVRSLVETKDASYGLWKINSTHIPPLWLLQ